MRQVHLSASESALSTSATQYIAPGCVGQFSDDEQGSVVIPGHGTAIGLVGQLTAAPGTGDTRTFTLMVNGSPTAVTITFGAADTSASISGQAVDLQPGDLISLQSTLTGTPSSASVRLSLVTDTDNGDEGFLFGTTGANALAGANARFGPAGHSRVQGTDNRQQIGVPRAITISAWYFHLSTAPGVGSTRSFTFQKNGATSVASMNIADAATSGSATGIAHALSEGDAIGMLNGGTGASSTGRWGILFVSSNREAIVLANAGSNNTNTRYAFLHGDAAGVGVSATEAARQLIGGLQWVLKDFHANVMTAPGAGTSRTFTVRLNGASSPIAVTLSNAETSGEVAGSLTIGASDLVSLLQTISGAVASSLGIGWSAVQVVNATPVITDGPTVDYGVYSGVFVGNPATVIFTATDADDAGVDGLEYEVRTAASGAGTLVASGTFTSGTEKEIEIPYNADGIIDGPQTLYLRVLDPLGAADEDSFSLNRIIVVTEDDEFPFGVGGVTEDDDEFPFGIGGATEDEDTFVYEVAPSTSRVAYALVGRFGPVRFDFRYERRTLTNQFLDDITPAIVGGTIDLNNDRDVLRTAMFQINPAALNDRGEPIVINPLTDNIAVFFDLLVDGGYTVALPMGIFSLTLPQKRHTPGGTTWEVQAADFSSRLMDQTTTGPYTVAAGQNYISGTNAVRDIFDAVGLMHAFPPTDKVLDADRPYAPGTPYLRIVNDLLQGAGYYIHWFNAQGVATSRLIEDLSTRTPDVTYTGDDFIAMPAINEETETQRLANQVIAVVEDPNRAIMTAVATNEDPDSPISTVNLGRTISKVHRANSAADVAVLQALAEQALREASAWYERAHLETFIDPRRDAREVYELDVDGIFDGSRWQSRNWSVQLRAGARMRHTVSRVRRVVASVSTVGGS